tara:strand:- start:15345 stop:15683 length:339 start_codon:yes stop_codon:yes gene_type:complete
MNDYPIPGDVIQFTKEHLYEPGYATVDGHSEYNFAVINASVYRTEDGRTVSCSGGPCPYLHHYKYEKVGPYKNKAWRWAKCKRWQAGGGEEYDYEATLWKCVGKTAAGTNNT